MPIIAQIKPNTFSFDTMTNDDLVIKTLTLHLKPFVSLINISDDPKQIISDIIENIDPPSDGKSIQTHKCFETINNMIYMMSCNADHTKPNLLCRYINEGFELTFGNCILINTTYENNKSVNCDITLRDVVEIFRSKLVHTAVLVTPENTIQTIEYTSNPIDNSSLFNENCRCIHIEFLGKNIVVFMEMTPQKDYMNKYATIVGKKFKVHGDIVIAMVSQFPTIETSNIDESLFKKILTVMSEHSIKRELDINNDLEPTQMNFYRMLDERYRICTKGIYETIPDDVLHGPTYNSTLTNN